MKKNVNPLRDALQTNHIFLILVQFYIITLKRTLNPITVGGGGFRSLLYFFLQSSKYIDLISKSSNDFS